jgi:hypothetical protein
MQTAILALTLALAGLDPKPAEPFRAAEPPPGIVIDHIPASTRTYIGSPSIAVLPDGSYTASHDIFGPKSGKDVTRVFASGDRGMTWRRIAEIRGQWWSTLFVHRGALYIMGTTREYGHVAIRRSTDGGRTWTEPRDGKSGLLHADGRYHCAPVPVAVHGGRIWRAMEDAMGPGAWGSHFRAFAMSAPEGADLLDAASWTSTDRIGRDPSWLEGNFNGWLEGNMVVAPDGKLYDVLRVDSPRPEKAALVEISADGKRATFDPRTGFVDFPGGAKKFTIRRDSRSGLYWSLTSPAVGHESIHPGRVRNTLALASSPDLRSWTVRSVLLRHPEPLHHGFQYVDWLFEGDDIIAVCRTAFDDEGGGAANYHDANYMTFHRIAGFRDLKDDGDPAKAGPPAAEGERNRK